MVCRNVHDLVRAGGESRQRVMREAAIFAEGDRIGRFEAGEARLREPISRNFPLGACGLQPIAQRHQLIDLGDDATLFGEGWERNFRCR